MKKERKDGYTMQDEREDLKMEKEKTGFEVLDEIQEITQPLCEYATILNMLVGYFGLNKLKPDIVDDKQLVAGRKDIYNTIMHVHRGIMDISSKIDNFSTKV